MPLAPTLDTIGLLARSASDMMPLVPIMAALPSAPPVARAAVLSDVVAESDPAIRRVVVAAVAALAGAGVAIEQRPALAALEAIDRHAMIVMQGESARVHRARIDDAAIAPVLRRRLAKGLEIADAVLAESIDARQRLVHDFEEQVLAGNDVAVLPVMGILTPSAAECDPASERFSPRTLYALSRFTRFVNMLGFPAVALPAGFDDRGLPIGVQIVGRSGCDLALLELVRHVQSKTDWHGRIPTAIAHLVPEPELSS
jgi:aspartyl-tRNA(Asn)/glutamyl-tRNA(Gln) amidotransferase subunit A